MSEPARKRRRRNQSKSTTAVIGLDDVPREKPKTAEEGELESFLFGKTEIRDEEEVTFDASTVDDSQLFVIDAPLAGVDADVDEEKDDYVQPSTISTRKTVWTDPADDAQGTTISLASNSKLRKLRDSASEDVVSSDVFESKLRQQYKKLNPTPSWAAEARKRKQQNDEDAAIDMNDVVSGMMNKTGSSKDLESGQIKMTRCKDANHESGQLKSSIRSLEFHDRSNLLLVANTTDHRVRLFNVDGVENKLVQSIHIPELHISKAQWHPQPSTGSKSILISGSAKPFLYSFDLASGTISKSSNLLRSMSSDRAVSLSGDKQSISFSPTGSFLAISNPRGYVSIFNHAGSSSLASSLQFTSTFKANNDIVDLQFASSHPHDMLTLGRNAECYLWDMRMMGKCKARWFDQGGFGSVACQSDTRGTYFAISSNTGIVNMYDQSVAFAPSPADADVSRPQARTPIKAIENLTTQVDVMSFNHDSQLVGLASSKKKEAFKLVHLPSMKVYGNWPTANTPLGYVTSVAFSRQGGEFLAIGNNKGKVILYSVDHYVDAKTSAV